MIEFRGFSFRYGGSKHLALRNISTCIDDGEFVLVSGPSGGGKSSLCRCINGLIPHFYGGIVSGDVSVNGLSIRNHAPSKLATVVGMTFQDPENQLVATDVEREVVFGMENLGFDHRLMSKRLEESLDTIGIAHLRHRVLTELSGGEKQKVAIASVLALHPRILVMDEPTSELDPKGAEEVLSVVQRLNDELGLTVVLVEHRLERVVHLVDRLILISEGQLIADGPPKEVLLDSKPIEIGVGVPPLIRLAHELRHGNGDVTEIPLTVKEGRRIFTAAFQKAQNRSEKRTTSLDGRAAPVVEMSNVSFVYPAGNTALRQVRVSFREGELAAIVGRNASGKSTLLKHLNGLLKPTRGEVNVNGTKTTKAGTAHLARTVGIVFQNPDDHLFADTVEEEIALTLKNFKWQRVAIEQRTNELLERFGLMRYRHQYPRYLSGGEKQRVAVASALASRPKVLALDEPTRGMDFRLKCDLMRLLREYCEEGNSVILVSHDVETVAEHADRVILMSEGRIVVDGDKHEVLSEALLFSPQVNRLMQAFGDYGLPKDVLTVDEALGLLT